MTTQRPTLPEKKWAELPDLESLRHAPIQEGRFSVAIDEGKFEACYWPKPGSGRLYVLLSGARDLKSRAWPNFDRWSWAPVFPGSVLCVADPTLALDTDRLRIGWYVGTRERDWLQGLADLVGAVADKAGVATRQVVCYGSSAGGFGALALACRLGDATAVAINPQTDVLKYHVRPVRQFLRIAFPGQDGAKLSPRERGRLSALEAVLASPGARCLLVQNRRDLHHYREHFLPMARRAGVDPRRNSHRQGRLWTLMYDGTSRHGPEPKGMVADIVAAAEALCRQDDAESSRAQLSVAAEAHAQGVSARACLPGAVEYAFYLYQDRERIAIQKYSASDSAQWPGADPARHRYRVKVYARRPDGSTVTAYAPVSPPSRPDPAQTRQR